MRILSPAARIIAYVFVTLILVLSTVPATLRPKTSIPHRLEHASILAATGFAFGLGYPRNRALLAVLLVIFSGLIELIQLLIPGRHARLSDFLVDALSVGGCTHTIRGDSPRSTGQAAPMATSFEQSQRETYEEQSVPGSGGLPGLINRIASEKARSLSNYRQAIARSCEDLRIMMHCSNPGGDLSDTALTQPVQTDVSEAHTVAIRFALFAAAQPQDPLLAASSLRTS